MDLDRFDLNLLRTLDALLRDLNVTRAAERLCVTQQAVSGSLQRLRHHLDDELLVRVGRRFEPTPLARSLVGPVREALHAARVVIETRPTFDPLRSHLTCRIAMSDYGHLVLLPRFLRMLASSAPKANCIVKRVGKRTLSRLEASDLDFCINIHEFHLYGNHVPSEQICCQSMYHDEFVCVVDPAQVDVSVGMSIELYRQLRHNVVSLGKGVSTVVQQAWASSSHEYDVAVTVSNFAALILMLPGTSLVATVQRRLADTLAPRLGLSVVPCPIPIPSAHLDLMWHRRSEKDPAHEFVRNLIVAAGTEVGDT